MRRSRGPAAFRRRSGARSQGITTRRALIRGPGGTLRDAVARIHPIAIQLGVGNGLPGAGPVPRELSSSELRLVAALGGADELRARIESFRRAVT